VNSELLCYTGYGITSDEKKLLVAGSPPPLTLRRAGWLLVVKKQGAWGMEQGAKGKVS